LLSSGHNDGCHRLSKATRLGREHLPCLVLTAAETLAIGGAGPRVLGVEVDLVRFAGPRWVCDDDAAVVVRPALRVPVICPGFRLDAVACQVRELGAGPGDGPGGFDFGAVGAALVLCIDKKSQI
jgi:hypothetical protein